MVVFMVSDERYYIESYENGSLIVDTHNSQVYNNLEDICDLLNEKEEEITRLNNIIEGRLV